ncbi:MAG: hypothetical protein ABMA25_11645 [Ilumatobacteraceae bacterium]
MARLGWPHRFVAKEWSDVREFEASVWATESRGRYLLEIIDSVMASGSVGDLAVTTSMHDLLVVGRPVPEPPMDVLIVRAPGSLHRPAEGHVLIEYLGVSGRDTRSERPSEEAVALFWRYVTEKFGVESTATGW